MPSTSIVSAPKDLELSALAAAVRLPCEHCVHFHREAARGAGASEREILEAIALAGLRRDGSPRP